MEKRRKILEAQERLENALSCPRLSSKKSIQSLVENQLLLTPFSGTEGEFGNLVEKRTSEVSNFLGMLRSASREDESASKSNGVSGNDWKLKQQTDQLRVMYREGPQGTPFHTLLCEGFADGPVDCCLCVSWESTLYGKWWPRYSIPTFNIVSISTLQKVRIGEEISIVRVKVPWPLSEREALLHNFELEYFEEDLVIVLINTIPETECIDVGTHGFSKDGIPEANGTVRIDLVGGFVIQKVSPNRSYFRAISNMDIKLDFVPPWLINFVARQLIGNGHKLYTKEVASVASGNKAYQEALGKAMYARIRDGLLSKKAEANGMQDVMAESCSQDVAAMKGTLDDEIEEEQGEHNIASIQSPPMAFDHRFSKKLTCSRRGGTFVSQEVERALGIVDEAILMVRNFQTSDSLASTSVVGHEPKLAHQAKESLSLQGECSLEKDGFGGDTNGFGNSPIPKDHIEGASNISVDNNLPSVMGGELVKTDLTRTQLPPAERMNKVYDEVIVKDSRADGKLMPKKRHRRKTNAKFCGLSFSP